MQIKSKSWVICLLLAFAFVISGAFTIAPTLANEANEPVEYPIEAEYDFTIEGSTISFLDKEGTLLTEELAWPTSEGVVEEWHIFMYRENKGNLKLGYSPEGKLFLPHKVYDGETADLLYVKDNNMFRVSATKDAVQTFDGSEILKTVSLKATNGTVTLASAPVYVETPFGFEYMGATDENGIFEINATLGEFKLWVSSYAGYILNKSVTVTNATTEINFADEITNAVEIDVTARSETYSHAPGYMVALGKPNEVESLNMITTSYGNPEKTVFVTPGTYSVSCGVWLEDHNSYYSTETSGGLWVDIAKSTTISSKTTYDFAITDFEGKYAIRDGYEREYYGIGDLMAYKVYAEHSNGFVIPGRAEYMEYLVDSVIITVGENEYPYTFCWSEFSMLYDTMVYKKGDYSTEIQVWESTDWEFSLSYDFFGETEIEYEAKYFPKWDSMSFPELFPNDVWYTATFKTIAVKGDSEYKEFESSEYFHNVYYLDENGVMMDSYYDYRDERFFYSVPTTVKNGDYLLGVVWEYERMVYGIIPVTDELFTSGYQFVDHSAYSVVNVEIEKDENGEADYYTSFDVIIEIGGDEFRLRGIESGMKIPYGQYTICANAGIENYDEEWNLIDAAIVTYFEQVTLSEETYTITLDYSTFKSFTIDATPYFDKYGYTGDYRKEVTLHYADGSESFVPFTDVPTTIYLQTLPEYATGEMYFLALEEMTPFSPFVSIGKFEIEDGGVYKFDFKPTKIEVDNTSSLSYLQIAR